MEAMAELNVFPRFSRNCFWVVIFILFTCSVGGPHFEMWFLLFFSYIQAELPIRPDVQIKWKP